MNSASRSLASATARSRVDLASLARGEAERQHRLVLQARNTGSSCTARGWRRLRRRRSWRVRPLQRVRARRRSAAAPSLLRRAQESDPAHPQAQRQTAARPGERDGKIRPAIVGDIQMTSEGEISAAANSVRTPSAVWAAMAARDARERDRAVVAPLRVPAGVASRQDLRTEPDWISIMIGGDSGGDDDLEQMSRRSARAPRRSRGASSPSRSASARPRNFGASRIADREREQLQRALGVEARPGREERELLGEIFGPACSGVCSTSTMPTSSCTSQSGEAR